MGGENAGSASARGEPVNRDLHPVGLFNALNYWNALFSPRLGRALTFAGRLNLWTLGLPIVGGSLLILAVVRRSKRGGRAVVPIVIASTGFVGMAADLLIIFAFQTLYGYVYHWVVLLITAFMAGLTLGGLLMTRRAVPGGARSTLLKLELAFVLYWVALPLILGLLYAQVAHPQAYTAIQALLLLLNAAAGFIVGAQFPVASRMWLRDREAVGGAAGALYASDLLGAFGGAIVVSVVLIPVLGILETCILAAVLKLGSLTLVRAIAEA